MDGLIDDQIADLALLVRVTDSGGFTAAARITGQPQSSISRRIALLEKRLGVRLLNRSTRRVALTDAGQRVYAHARLMLDQAEVIGAVARGLQAEPSGTLRVMAPVILGQAFVADAMADFMALHPRVTVKLELSSRSVDLIEEGIDISLHIGRVPDSAMAITTVGKVHTALYASRRYLETTPPIREPGDLMDHAILAIGLSLTAGPLEFRKEEQVVQVTPVRRLASNDVQPLLAAAQAGVGAALLPSFTGDAAVRQSRLVAVLPDWHMADIAVHAVTPSSKGALPSVRQFLAALRARLQGGASDPAG